MSYELVCSEGGEDASNFNRLRRWAAREVRFPLIGALRAPGAGVELNRARRRFRTPRQPPAPRWPGRGW
jgi:hypothetical protein